MSQFDSINISNLKRLEKLRDQMMDIIIALPDFYSGKSFDMSVDSGFYRDIIDKGFERIKKGEPIDNIRAFFYSHYQDLVKEVENLRLKRQAFEDDASTHIEFDEDKIRKGWDFI